MPHRQLVGTFHPCGTIARYTGRDHDFKKSLHLGALESPLWQRGVVATSLLGKALHSNFILPTASYQKIQDIAKPGRPDPAPAPAPECSKAGVESVAMGSADRAAKIGCSSLSKRSGSGDLAKLLQAQNSKPAVEKEAERGGVKLADSGSSWITGPTPTIDRPQRGCEPIHRSPRFPSTRGKVRTSHGKAALPKPMANMEQHPPASQSPKKSLAPRPAAKRMPVRVSMTLSTTGNTPNGLHEDDSVLLMVPHSTLGERVIELALAAGEFDRAHHVEHEDPSHFALLRMSKISGDRFQIGPLFDGRKPVGEAGTGYFVLCKTTA